MSSSDVEDMPELEEEGAANGERTMPTSRQTASSAAAGIDPQCTCRQLPASVDSDDEDGDEEGYQDEEEEPILSEQATCLFCSHRLPVLEIFSHCREQHEFDIGNMIQRNNMDSLDYIRLVNFVREKQLTSAELVVLKPAAWSDQKYMKPTVEDDPLLMIDVDDLTESAASAAATSAVDLSRHVVNVEDAFVTLSVEHYHELQEELTRLRRQLDTNQQLMTQMAEDMAKMRTTMHQVLNLEEEDKATAASVTSPGAQTAAACTGDGYFESYSHFGIHHEMLSDRVRTESYREAISRNALPCIRGRSVLDLGCGTAILSMFCARAGAASVVGVDQSDVIYSAMDIVRENRLGDVVTLVKGRLEDLQLPGGPDCRFDVIVSEWMGYFLLFEGMLDSVLWARDKLLADGGVLMPNRCTISLVAVSDTDRYDSLLSFWSDVYGFQMTCLRSEVLQEASVEVVPEQAVCSQHGLLKTLDLNTITVEDTEFTSPFALLVERECRVTALAGYFDTFFDLPLPVSFSTGPQATPTHWKQTVFYLNRPIDAKAGERIEGRLFCSRDRKDPRSLRVIITMNGKSQSYRVS